MHGHDSRCSPDTFILCWNHPPPVPTSPILNSCLLMKSESCIFSLLPQIWMCLLISHVYLIGILDAQTPCKTMFLDVSVGVFPEEINLWISRWTKTRPHAPLCTLQPTGARMDLNGRGRTKSLTLLGLINLLFGGQQKISGVYQHPIPPFTIRLKSLILLLADGAWWGFSALIMV